MSLGTTYSPAVPVGGAASYKLRPVFTYSKGYWEVYRRFQGDFFGLGGDLRGGFTWEDLTMEELLMGEETFNGGGAGFSSIIKKKNNEKINMKSFFYWKWGAALILKTSRNYYAGEGFTSS